MQETMKSLKNLLGILLLATMGSMVSCDKTEVDNELKTDDLVSGKVWVCEDLITTENPDGELVEVGEALILDFISPNDGGRFIVTEKTVEGEESYLGSLFTYSIDGNNGNVVMTVAEEGTFNMPFIVNNSRLQLTGPDGDVFEFIDKGNREEYPFNI